MTIESLAEAFDFTEAAIRGVGADQWTDSTPCSDWDVRELVHHTITAISAFAATASGRGRRVDQDDDGLAGPAGAFRRSADEALAAWPAALDESVQLGLEPVPGRIALAMNLLDTLVHGWDIATATGQPAELPRQASVDALAAARTIVTDQFRATVGFAPPAAVDDDASPTEQLVAFLGRRG